MPRPRKPRPQEAELEPVSPPAENLDATVFEDMASAVSPGEEVGVRGDLSLSLLRDVEVLGRPLDATDELLTPSVKGKMMLDAVINSTLHWLVSAALDGNFKYTPAVRDRAHRDYRESLRAYDMTMRCLEPSADTLPDSYQGIGVEQLALGCAIGEKVAPVVGAEGRGVERYWRHLTALKHRPPETVAFVVDPHMNVLGIASKVVRREKQEDAPPPSMTPLPPTGRGGMSRILWGGTGQQMPPDWEVFPRAKWSVISNRPPHGDPRGTSLLRHIYNEWYLIQAIWPHYLKYLLKFASPSLDAELGDKAVPRVVNGKRVDPLDELYASLKRFENSSVIARRHGGKLQLLYSQGEGQAFVAAIGLLERRILRGLTNQVLASAEGKHMARAASQTHQDSQNVVVRGIKSQIVTTHRNDDLKFLVRLNMGERAVRLTPHVSLGGVAPEDQASMMNATGNLWRSGYMNESQMREHDAAIGLPYRETPGPGFYPSGALSEETFEQGPPEPAPPTGEPSGEENQEDEE